MANAGQSPLTCPVCEAPARDITAGGFDGRSIRCTRCGDYNVAGGYEEKLAALDPDNRKRALQKAQRFAQPGSRPCISGTCF